MFQSFFFFVNLGPPHQHPGLERWKTMRRIFWAADELLSGMTTLETNFIIRFWKNFCVITNFGMMQKYDCCWFCFCKNLGIIKYLHFHLWSLILMFANFICGQFCTCNILFYAAVLVPTSFENANNWFQFFTLIVVKIQKSLWNNMCVVATLF